MKTEIKKIKYILPDISVTFGKLTTRGPQCVRVVYTHVSTNAIRLSFKDRLKLKMKHRS